MQETQETQVWSLDWEDSLEKEVVIHSDISSLENSMDRGDCGLKSKGSQWVWHDWASSLAFQQSILCLMLFLSLWQYEFLSRISFLSPWRSFSISGRAFLLMMIFCSFVSFSRNSFAGCSILELWVLFFA